MSAREAATATARSATSCSAASSQRPSVPVGFEQPVAVAQGPVERVDTGAVAGIDREHQAIEEAPALARRAREQAVHRRRQPDDTQMLGEGGGGRDGDTLDPAAARPLAGGLRRRCQDARVRPRRRPRRRRRRRRRFLDGIVRLARSSRSARRRPLPGVNSDSASRTLVLPAPFAPVSTTSLASTARSSRRIGAKTRQQEARDAGFDRHTRIGIST